MVYQADPLANVNLVSLGFLVFTQYNGYDKSYETVCYSLQFHSTVGQDSTGFAFDLDYHSEQKFVDFAAIYNEARKHDPISAVVYAWAEESINLNNITVAYNPQKSSAKYARFTATYRKYFSGVLNKMLHLNTVNNN